MYMFLASEGLPGQLLYKVSENQRFEALIQEQPSCLRNGKNQRPSVRSLRFAIMLLWLVSTHSPRSDLLGGSFLQAAQGQLVGQLLHMRSV